MCSIPNCTRPVVARGWCRLHYRRWHRHGNPLGSSSPRRFRREQSESTRAKISAKAKGRKASEATRQKISESHRGKRHGRQAAGVTMIRGYKYLTGQYDHPLSDTRGQIAEHRKVLYDKIGPGPHMCHWRCGRMLSWDGGPQLGICADHLDNNRLNNDPDNLVPSCRRENIARAWWGVS